MNLTRQNKPNTIFWNSFFDKGETNESVHAIIYFTLHQQIIFNFVVLLKQSLTLRGHNNALGADSL